MGRRILSPPRRLLDDYEQYGALFNGTSQALTATMATDLPSIANGKLGMVVFGIKSNGDGVEQYVCHASNNYFFVSKTNLNKISIRARNIGGTADGLLITSNGTITNDGNWHTVIASWDLSTTTFNMYIDGVLDAHTGTVADETIDYTRTAFNVGSTTDPILFLDGCLSNFGFNDTYLDLTVQANRDAIVSTTSMLDPASDGSNYFGVQPAIMLQARGAAFAQNSGIDSNFTGVGANLTACDP